MDDSQFDLLARSLSAAGSRRQAVAATVAGLGTMLGMDAAIDARKKKKKKKKKKKPNPPQQCASGETVCDFLCCPTTQSSCCAAGSGSPLCFDEASESCCPDLGGQVGAACPPGTRCEFFDDPNDTVGPASFCCPSGTTKCGFGCCPDGSVCCSSAEDPGYAWQCCPDSSCDEIETECTFSGHHIVDPRIF